MDVCVPCSARCPRRGLPGEGWARLQGAERQAGDRSPSCGTPQRLQLLQWERGPAGPRPLISLSALRSWQELPLSTMLVAGSGGVQATWLPLARVRVLWECRVSRTPTLLSVSPFLQHSILQG